MSAAFTVILPHRRNPGNNLALQVALDCLQDNTTHDFKLLMDAAVDEPLYPRVNAMMYQANTECCVYWASDTFAAPGWDTAMLSRWTPDTIVTGVVCEPGVIGIHHENVGIDFGRTPEQFRRQDFEAWVANDPPLPSGTGFPAPYMIGRTAFFELGGLDDNGLNPDHHGFTAADDALFDRWRASGRPVVRAPAYVYHLQRWSQVDEQEAEKRR